VGHIYIGLWVSGSTGVTQQVWPTSNAVAQGYEELEGLGKIKVVRIKYILLSDSLSETWQFAKFLCMASEEKIGLFKL